MFLLSCEMGLFFIQLHTMLNKVFSLSVMFLTPILATLFPRVFGLAIGKVLIQPIQPSCLDRSDR